MNLQLLNLIQRAMVIIIVSLLTTTLTSAQSWDWVNFINSNTEYTYTGTIDPSDNYYILGSGASYNAEIRKYNPGGTLLLWTKDISSLTQLPSYNWRGGMDYYNNTIYTVGKNSTGGVIVSTGTSPGDTPSIWSQVTGNSFIHDIVIEGDQLFVVGTFGSVGSSTTSITVGGTTISGTWESTFIARFDIPTQNLVWVKKVNASNIVRGHNIDVSNALDVYISGKFRGTATFYDGGTPYSFNSNNGPNLPVTFLARFDSSGDFYASSGFVANGANSGNNKVSFDVEVDDANNAVY